MQGEVRGEVSRGLWPRAWRAVECRRLHFAPATGAGEMSPNGIPKYLKRPLWRERKCPGRGGRGEPRDRGTAARAPVARRPPPPPLSTPAPSAPRPAPLLLHSSAPPHGFIQPRPGP
ncbi:unnamed protein product, partial [Iphiclides podalirius]